MILVDNKQIRRLSDLSELANSNTAIAAVGADERGNFIDKNAEKCSALRDPLWKVGLMKCWYSEAALQQPEGQVEHYRPKKRLSDQKVPHAGYWWRAFDWENLRLAHPTVNRRKTDYITGKRAGKGSYFPLRHESARAKNLHEEAKEEPVLLDPIVAADTRLLCFSEESGAPSPRYSKEQEEWLHQRARESIEYYHLNEASWNAKRADLMAIVRKLCDQLEKLAEGGRAENVAYMTKIDEIVDYIKPTAEFSAACAQVVRERGLLDKMF
jgi:hypothetical protein